jgi:diguanylate cyclase (GGDEF)-like protein
MFLTIESCGLRRKRCPGAGRPGGSGGFASGFPACGRLPRQIGTERIDRTDRTGRRPDPARSKVLAAANKSPRDTDAADSLLDGALDTLGSVFQTFGKDSFLIDSDFDPAVFPDRCADVVRHIEYGADAPDLGLKAAGPGYRDWASVRRFFADRRQREKSFVNHAIADYRGAVEDLVVGLSEICRQGDVTEASVRSGLEAIKSVIDNGDLPDIKRALADTMTSINEAFSKQKRQYEQQIAHLQDRMSGLKQDLLAAHEEMKQDPLTRVYNRRAFDAAIDRCLNMQAVLQQPISLVMIDVDNFKAINDTLGHAGGDELLLAVANLMNRSFVRKNDIICRYGGDEFAVILPDTAADKSRVSIERFLDGVNGLGADDWPEGLEISCSAGCAEIEDGDTVESLIGRADRALYDAKQAGRNRLRIAAKITES